MGSVKLNIPKQEFRLGRSVRSALAAISVFFFVSGAIMLVQSHTAGGLGFLAAGVVAIALRNSRYLFGVFTIDTDGLTITRGQNWFAVPWSTIQTGGFECDQVRVHTPNSDGGGAAASVVAQLLIGLTSDGWVLHLNTAKVSEPVTIRGTDMYQPTKARACLERALRLLAKENNQAES